MAQIADLMTTKIITVSPQTPLIEAVDVLTRNNFNGLPVVDQNGVLVGLLTERSLLLSDSFVHLQTLLKLLNKFEFYKKDNIGIKGDLQKLMSLKVSQVMINQPVVLFLDSTVETAASLMGNPDTNPIPVVDSDRKLIGILSLSDLTKLYGITTRDPYDHKNLDNNIEQFLDKFEEKFVLVSRFRTDTWLITSVVFAIVGFIVAFMIILRIN